MTFKSTIILFLPLCCIIHNIGQPWLNHTLHSLCVVNTCAKVLQHPTMSYWDKQQTTSTRGTALGVWKCSLTKYFKFNTWHVSYLTDLWQGRLASCKAWHTIWQQGVWHTLCDISHILLHLLLRIWAFLDGLHCPDFSSYLCLWKHHIHIVYKVWTTTCS